MYTCTSNYYNFFFFDSKNAEHNNTLFSIKYKETNKKINNCECKAMEQTQKKIVIRCLLLHGNAERHTYIRKLLLCY